MKTNLELQVRRVRTSVRSDVNTGSGSSRTQSRRGGAYGDSSGVPLPPAGGGAMSGAVVYAAAPATY